MADTIWSTHPNTYVILEHWSDNNEEKILSNYGMMLWGNITHSYQESGMGYTTNSDLSWGVYNHRGWTEPHLITYMESHDEERIMYKNITYGNSNGNHNAKDPITALERCEALSVILLTTPGPKMIWQFGEIGYDISIDYPCRICNKPILWNYFTENSRKRLYDVYKATIELRKNFSAFTGNDYTYSLNHAVKTLQLNDTNMNAIVIANIDVQDQNKTLSFQHDGWWYEYFSGDSILIIGNTTFTLTPGEYRIYTDQRLPLPTILSTVGINEYGIANWDISISPNPVSEILNISINKCLNQPIQYTILNTNGKIVYQKKENYSLKNEISISSLKSGIYYLVIEQNNELKSKEFIKL